MSGDPNKGLSDNMAFGKIQTFQKRKIFCPIDNFATDAGKIFGHQSKKYFFFRQAKKMKK